MKKIGIYPGSFNPWHKGHRDILDKACEIFDVVHVCFMVNPEKEESNSTQASCLAAEFHYLTKVKVRYSEKTLVEIVRETALEYRDEKGSVAVIRGLRNGNDLQYEMNNQYWNEDVGLGAPFVYFITDRALAHVSSSAIRSLNKLGLKNPY